MNYIYNQFLTRATEKVRTPVECSTDETCPEINVQSD